MSNYNRTVLTGHLTRKPETKELPSGTTVTECSLAVNKSWKDKSGEWQEKVSYVPCKIWGERGPAIAERFDKGQHVLIEGEIDMDSWEDKETGKKREKLSLIITKMLKLGRLGGGEPNEAPKAAPKKDDDVPF